MKELKIDKEFEKLIPKLTDEEFNQLEENCKNHGIQDSIKIWSGENIIIDGHNRYKIAEKNNLQYETEYMSFNNRIDVIEWMINNQRGRRNLNNYDRGLLALKLQDILKIKGLENKSKANRTSRKLNNDSPTLGNVDSEKQASEAFNVSKGTLNKVKHIEEKADEETKNKLKKGEITVNKAYQDIKKPHIVNNSGDNEWYTPEVYIKAVIEVMNNIDLDPASSIEANKIVKANKIYTIKDNGLTKKWKGNIWINPPYSINLINKFIDKIIEELNNINQCILLVNNATDTIWFHKIINYSNAICFPKGRIKFYQPNNNKCSPLQGQCFIYFGNNSNKFINIFSKYGWCTLNVKS